MGEKRKPYFTFLIKETNNDKLDDKSKKPKTAKVELFLRDLWMNESCRRYRGQKFYRIRVNGKWFPNKEKRFFNKWQIRDLIWRSINI